MIDIPKGYDPTSDRHAIVLAELMALTAMTKERRRGYWIPVGSRHWRKLIGSRYKYILDDLVVAGCVEVNNRYSVGSFSKSYRLSSPFRNPKMQTYRLGPTGELPNRVRIEDDDEIGQLLVEQFPRLKILGTATGWDGFCASQIRQLRHYATRCAFGRRFHSSFTGLKRRSRSFLVTTEGDSLVEIDVHNCQPLLLGILAIRKEQQQTEAREQTPSNTHNTVYSICGAHKDLKRYLSLCSSGCLYEHLLKLCDGRITLRHCFSPERWHRHATDRPLKRKDVKRQFLVALFERPEITRRMPIFDIVGTEFPAVADFILTAKKQCHQDLARSCQRLESRVMIDSACGAIFHDSPRTHVLTIHDAILTTPDAVPLVADCIKQAFEQFGIRPALSGCHLPL